MDKASAAKRRKLAGLAAVFLPLATLGLPGNADAKIIKIVIAKKAPAFEGATFGAVGAYEQLDGTAYGEIDPRDPLNAVITDIALAPRNAGGMVEYSMGISILKPVDMSKGNRTLLYEVVNRGRKNLPALNIGGDGAKAGDGFLEHEGYTQAWSGWEGDITAGIKIALPVAANPDGSPITGQVRAEYILTAASATVNVTAPPAYESASLDNKGATLTRRVHQNDARETIDNSKWAFADCKMRRSPASRMPARSASTAALTPTTSTSSSTPRRTRRSPASVLRRRGISQRSCAAISATVPGKRGDCRVARAVHSTAPSTTR